MHDTTEGEKSTLTNKNNNYELKIFLPLLFLYNLFITSFKAFQNIFALGKSGIIYLLCFNTILIVSCFDALAISPSYPSDLYGDRDKISRSFFLSQFLKKSISLTEMDGNISQTIFFLVNEFLGNTKILEYGIYDFYSIYDSYFSTLPGEIWC